MEGLRAYNLFNGFNLHLTTEYDVVKYKGKMRTKEETFRGNRFRWQFAQLEKSNNEAELFARIYLLFRKFNFKKLSAAPVTFQALNRSPLKSQLAEIRLKILEDLSLINQYGWEIYGRRDSDSMYVWVYQMYVDGLISVETLVLLDKFVYKFLFTENSKDVIIWPMTVKSLKKIQSLVIQIFVDEELASLFTILNQREL